MWSVMSPPPEVNWFSAWACLPTHGQNGGQERSPVFMDLKVSEAIKNTLSHYYSFYTHENGHRNIREFSEGTKTISGSGLPSHTQTSCWVSLCSSQKGAAGQLALSSLLLNSIRMMMF